MVSLPHMLIQCGITFGQRIQPPLSARSCNGKLFFCQVKNCKSQLNWCKSNHSMIESFVISDSFYKVRVIGVLVFLFVNSVVSYGLYSLKTRQRILLQKNLATDEVLFSYFRDNTTKKILGFGSLLSITSSRMTFPNLTNFTVVRVEGYRRVFRHPAGIFFERGISNFQMGQYSSLSIEECEGHGFYGVVFSICDVSASEFLSREEEFNFVKTKYQCLNCINSDIQRSSCSCRTDEAIMCVHSSDDVYLKRWGKETFDQRYKKYGITTIWGYDKSSEILPCSVYLRHCYLSALKLGKVVLDSFLDETYLVDRVTTIREYLDKNPWILELKPPESLIGRYSG